VSKNEDRLPFSAQGLLTQLRGDSTQLVKQALLRLRLVPPPLRLVLDVTDRCNFHCPTCSKWRGESAREELGLAGTLVVIALYGVYLLRGLRAAARVCRISSCVSPCQRP